MVNSLIHICYTVCYMLATHLLHVQQGREFTGFYTMVLPSFVFLVTLCRVFTIPVNMLLDPGLCGGLWVIFGVPHTPSSTLLLSLLLQQLHNVGAEELEDVLAGPVLGVILLLRVLGVGSVVWGVILTVQCGLRFPLFCPLKMDHYLRKLLL